ncbi:MAG: hypothetical protein GY733_08255 [bacterium]|nr:hypothetical protein [bacterium]
MPSSTSSSDSAPLWPWSWLVALVLVIVGVATWEVFWRGHDFAASVTDDAGLWARARHRANTQGEDAVVLVGSSRMQMDIQRDAFARTTGWAPAIQLAVVRGPSFPVLENLARDERFRGTVICEINPVLFFAHTPRIDRMLDGHFRTFEELSLGGRIEQWLAMHFQKSFVTRLPELSYAPLRQAWDYGRLPLPSYNAVISQDRFRYGDYLKVPSIKRVNLTNAKLMAQTTPKVLAPSQFARRLRQVGEFVRAIDGRGGNVVFVHLPSSLHVLDYERRWWKREQFWDELVLATDAAAVHYLDHPTLTGFDPPDGDHLGRDAADLFSERLGRVLVELGVAPGPG